MHIKAIKTIYKIIDDEVGNKIPPLDILYTSNKIIESIKKEDKKHKTILGHNLKADNELIAVDEAMNDNSFDYVFSQKCSLFPNNEDDNIFHLKKDNSITLERIL